jgi:hypothetical protein
MEDSPPPATATPARRHNRPVISAMPPDKNMVRRETHCSRIIQQRCQREVRFRAQETFVYIVRANHGGVLPPAAADGSYPRPLTSPLPCFNCHQTFTGPPVFIPMTTLDGARTEWGNFCCGPCANTYLHINMNDCALPGRAADLFEYMQDVHGFDGQQLGLAPHFSQLQTYGGDLSPEQFAAIAQNARLTTHLRMKPFIPTPVVVEWQLTGSAEGASAAAANTAALAAAMGSAAVVVPGADDGGAVTAPAVGTKAPAQHHKMWTVRNKQQPSLEQIEERLASLPPTEKRVGLYELFLQRMGGFDETTGTVAVPPSSPPTGGAAALPAKPARERKPRTVKDKDKDRGKDKDKDKDKPAKATSKKPTTIEKLLKTPRKRQAGAAAQAPAAPLLPGPAGLGTGAGAAAGAGSASGPA